MDDIDMPTVRLTEDQKIRADLLRERLGLAFIKELSKERRRLVARNDLVTVGEVIDSLYSKLET